MNVHSGRDELAEAVIATLNIKEARSRVDIFMREPFFCAPVGARLIRLGHKLKQAVKALKILPKPIFLQKEKKPVFKKSILIYNKKSFATTVAHSLSLSLSFLVRVLSRKRIERHSGQPM